MMRFSSPIGLFILMSLLSSASSFRLRKGENKLSTAGDMSLVQAEANSSGFCNPFGSRTLKTYFFDFKFAGREHPTAMSLTRDPTDPQLNVFDDMSWVIYQRDKTTAVIDCSKSVNTKYIQIERRTSERWGQPDRCSKDLDGQKGFIVQSCASQNSSWFCHNDFETKCSGWYWFGQCPEIQKVNLTDGRIVYLPKDNVRRTANSKPEGDGWIAQDNQGPSDQPLYWRPECAQNASECSGAHQVIKLRNLASITRRHIDVKDPETGGVERLSGIRLKHADGTEQDILGGMYYPYETMRQLTWESRIYGANKSIGCFNCTQSPGENRDGISALSLVWEGNARRGTIFRGSMLALIAGFGFVANIPITTGLLIWGGGDRAYDWWRAHKHVQELKLSATEKIWSKLECHAMFKRCSEDVLVPTEKSCDGI